MLAALLVAGCADDEPPPTRQSATPIPDLASAARLTRDLALEDPSAARALAVAALAVERVRGPVGDGLVEAWRTCLAFQLDRPSRFGAGPPLAAGPGQVTFWVTASGPLLDRRGAPILAQGCPGAERAAFAPVAAPGRAAPRAAAAPPPATPRPPAPPPFGGTATPPGVAAPLARPAPSTPVSAPGWATYLGHFEDAESARAYLDWVWRGWSATLTGGAPRILELPAPDDARRFHAYVAGLTRAAAASTCAQLPESQPCAVVELGRAVFGLDPDAPRP